MSGLIGSLRGIPRGLASLDGARISEVFVCIPSTPAKTVTGRRLSARSGARCPLEMRHVVAVSLPSERSAVSAKGILN